MTIYKSGRRISQHTGRARGKGWEVNGIDLGFAWIGALLAPKVREDSPAMLEARARMDTVLRETLEEMQRPAPKETCECNFSCEDEVSDE